MEISKSTAEIWEMSDGGYTVLYSWAAEDSNYSSTISFSTLTEVLDDVCDFYNSKGRWEEE